MRAAVVLCLAAPYVVVVACGGARSDPPQSASEVTIPVSAPSPPDAPAATDAAPPPAATASASSAPAQPPHERDAVSGPADFGMIGLIGADDDAGLGNTWGDGFGTGGLGLAGAGGSKRPTPSLRQGVVQVNGQLPPEVIQRIVRQNFGRFRLCYEKALRTKPKLAGRIALRFVIDRSGAPTQITVTDATTKAPELEQCVARAFEVISFPQPEKGTVVVVYPINFAPASD